MRPGKLEMGGLDRVDGLEVNREILLATANLHAELVQVPAVARPAGAGDRAYSGAEIRHHCRIAS